MSEMFTAFLPVKPVVFPDHSADARDSPLNRARISSVIKRSQALLDGDVGLWQTADNMKQRVITFSIIVLANACIWGLVIILSSHSLRGTGAYQEIQHILGGGAAASLLVVGGGCAGLMRSLKSGT